MLIQVNGQSREVDDNVSLSQLIVTLALKPEQIAVELNQKVIRRAEWQTLVLRDADKIEIVHFVGGGGNQEPGAGGRSSRQVTKGGI